MCWASTKILLDSGSKPKTNVAYDCVNNSWNVYYRYFWWCVYVCIKARKKNEASQGKGHIVGFITHFVWWWPHCGVYHTFYVMMTTLWGLSYTLCDDDHIVGFINIIHFMWWWPHCGVYHTLYVMMTTLWGLTLSDDDHIVGFIIRFMWWWPHCGV